MKKIEIGLNSLNQMDHATFAGVCGSFFEHSPWIAERTWARRPFASLEALHQALIETLRIASIDEQVKLIAAHPDLVGRLAREGKLTRESTAEQSAAGLGQLSDDEIARFDQYNAQYREKFGFPFVICARENRKETILKAFPVRLQHSREQEIASALIEIGKIARLRLLDALTEE